MSFAHPVSQLLVENYLDTYMGTLVKVTVKVEITIFSKRFNVPTGVWK